MSRFDRLLLKVPEHTWGLDVKTTLENFDCCGTYSNEHLHACMRGQEPPQAAVTVEGSTVANPQQQQQRQRMLSSVGDVSSSPPDPPGCGGMTRLVTSWQRQAAYVDWALQVHVYVGGRDRGLSARGALCEPLCVCPAISTTINDTTN